MKYPNVIQLLAGDRYRSCNGLIQKFFRMVKLVAFFLCAGMVAVHAHTYSQNISVNIRNGTLADLFEEIQKQSEFVFFYRDDLIPKGTISISSKQENIQRLLNRVLAQQRLEYRITGNQITIKRSSRNQQHVIRGTIRDKTGVPLEAVSVLVKGTNIGVVSNSNGQYEIRTEGEATLIFSIIGYRDQEVQTNGQRQIDIVMTEEANNLEEVVVMGYNQIERQHLASSISELDMKLAKSRPVAKLEEVFSGTIPGLTILQGHNLPGAGPGALQIRGVSTLQGAAPLVIVDGMEQSLSDLDPNQIKSISVLKDAASASMYGSRGANGVIIIETERGQTGKFKVDLHSWNAYFKPIDQPDFVDSWDFMRLNNEARLIQGQTPIFSDEDIANAEAGLTSNVDWAKEVMQKQAVTHNTSANISGGGGVGTFNLMLNYMNEGGLNHIEGTEKYGARFNTNIHIADKFELLADFYAHRLQVDRLLRNDNGHGLYQVAWRMDPTQAVSYDSDLPDHYILHNALNPLAFISHGGIKNYMHDRSTINLRPRYYITRNLHLNGNVSYLINKSASKEKRETFKLFDGDGKPVATWANHVAATQEVSTSQITARATVNYDQRLRKNKDMLYFVGGTELMSHVYTDYREITKASFFGKLNYSFDNRYLAEITIRSDGSSKFAPGHRWGLFPSGALAWNAHNEGFMKTLKDRGVVNNLKIRYSYGLIGNENVDPYLWQEVVNTWGWMMRVPNYSFTWEKQKQHNIGLDLTVLNQRLNLTAEYYNKYSYDLIYDAFPVPPLTGSHTLESAVNIGDVENKGWELSASWNDKVGDFSYSLGAMLFDNTNKVLKAGYNTSDTLIFKNDNDKIWYRGIAIDNYYGYLSDGYFQTNEEVNSTAAKLPNTMRGDIKYVDLNGDGIINDLDKVNLGDPFPHMNYSVNFNAGYKRWDFTVLGQGVGRRSGRLNGQEGYPVLVDGATNSLGAPRREYMENRWRQTGPLLARPVIL